MNPDAGAGSQPDPQDDKLRRALRGSEQGDQGDNEGKEGQGGKEGKEGLRGKDGKEAGKPSRLRPRGAPAKPSEDAPAPTQSAAPAPPAGGAAVPEAAFAAAATAPPAAAASAPRADAPDAAGPNAAGPLFDRPVGRTDSQSKEFLQAVKRQQKLRRQQDLEEARRLQDQAKQMMQKTKQKERTASQLQKHEDWVTRVAAELGFDPDRPITEVPPVPTGMEEVEFHTMRTGRAFVRLLYDNATNSYMYEVIEPKLNNTEMEVFHFLRETLIRTLDGRQGRDPNTDWDEILLNAIQQAILDHSVLVDQVSTQRIQYHLVRDFLGYGPIDTMMQDPMLEDLSCDGPGIPIYVFHRKYESIRSTVTFPDEETLDSFVIRLAQRSGKHISIAEPILDATLPDGSRLQTTLSREVTTRGSSFTIRKFRADPFTPPDLVGYNTMDSRMAAYMWLVVENGSSMIMAGGTASGKTTTLNATCQFVPPEKKIVSIEDTREINLNHENWIAGVTRAGFGGQIVGGKPAGAIDMYKLLEAALRQRPEYLLVGEVRGPEALTLFQAMATGHTVYSTMHADSVASAVYRLENPPHQRAPPHAADTGHRGHPGPGESAGPHESARPRDHRDRRIRPRHGRIAHQCRIPLRPHAGPARVPRQEPDP
jgi:type IV secretory pathway ATPase VirB11/archaellum biosynthesis ATPase